MNRVADEDRPTNIQFVSFFAGTSECSLHFFHDQNLSHSPLKVDGLDNEAQRRADLSNIFVHDFLNNGSLARVVETPIPSPT